jgi:hypothetical protein
MRLNKKIVSCLNREEAEQQELESYQQMLPLERLRLMTYLRECYYGEEATTGRLQRVFELVESK